MEEWKDIKGFEGIYQVSNKGRVRTFRTKDGWVGFKITDTPKVMSTISHGNGYVYVTLVKDGKHYNKYVHRLVAESFIGDISKGMVVNHLDYDRSKNCADNLEIITQKENTLYSKAKMSKPKTRNDNSYIRLRENVNMYEVTVNRQYLGIYRTLEEARSVRDAYIKEINYY